MARKKDEVTVLPRPEPKRTVVKTLRSKIGSSIYIPSMNLDERKMGIGLEAPYDHWGYIPDGWETNPYLIDYAEKGMIELGESEGMPPPAPTIPEEMDNYQLDPSQREWIRTLCYGPYSEQFSSQLTDWKDRGLASKTGRQDILVTRVSPMCKAAIEIERLVKNRPDVIGSLESVIEFVENEGWRGLSGPRNA